MSLSTDVLVTRRAISAPRTRSNHQSISSLNKSLETYSID
jgi:hypothetical protein